MAAIIIICMHDFPPYRCRNGGLGGGVMGIWEYCPRSHSQETVKPEAQKESSRKYQLKPDFLLPSRFHWQTGCVKMGVPDSKRVVTEISELRLLLLPSLYPTVGLHCRIHETRPAFHGPRIANTPGREHSVREHFPVLRDNYVCKSRAVHSPKAAF